MELFLSIWQAVNLTPTDKWQFIVNYAEIRLWEDILESFTYNNVCNFSLLFLNVVFN